MHKELQLDKKQETKNNKRPLDKWAKNTDNS